MECYTSYDHAMTTEVPFDLDAESRESLLCEEPEEISDSEDICSDDNAVLSYEYGDDAIKIYLQKIRKAKLLTAEEERELAVRIEKGDRAARDRMIEANLRLVVSISKRYMNRGLPFADLIEEGNLGLMKAVDRFQVSKECRFSTYATWWIRQAVERALMNYSRTVRLPVHIAEGLSRMNRTIFVLRGQLKREPTSAEIAGALDMEEHQVRKLMVLTRKTFSLDHPCGDEKDHSLIETIEDSAATSPESLSEELDSYRLISQLMDTLPSSERRILTLRFGLDDHEPQTLDEIGRSFGVTRERIRQIESKSLQKLRALIQSPQLRVAHC